MKILQTKIPRIIIKGIWQRVFWALQASPARHCCQPPPGGSPHWSIAVWKILPHRRKGLVLMQKY